MNKQALFKSKIHEIDVMIALEVFILSVLELISWRLQAGTPATITDVGNNYLVYKYPLMCSISFWVVSLCLFLKIVRFKVCIYTIIVTNLYLLVQTATLAAFVIGFGMETYDTIVYPIILFGIIFLTLISFTRWFLK